MNTTAGTPGTQCASETAAPMMRIALAKRANGPYEIECEHTKDESEPCQDCHDHWLDNLGSEARDPGNAFFIDILKKMSKNHGISVSKFMKNAGNTSRGTEFMMKFE